MIALICSPAYVTNTHERNFRELRAWEENGYVIVPAVITQGEARDLGIPPPVSAATPEN